MNTLHLSLSASGKYPKVLTDYLKNRPELKQFYRYAVDTEGFASKIEASSTFSTEKRQVLVDTLKRQYSNLSIKHSEIEKNIELLLKPNTFTITTGHQICLFGGPAFFVLKIAATIALCKKLREEHPDKNFVPVFWMATEDHDFKEIAEVQLFGKAYSFAEFEKAGPVGRYSTYFLKEIPENLEKELPLFAEAYRKYQNLADATQAAVSAIFAEFGLVVLNPDDHYLKSMFKEVMIEEVKNQATEKLVLEQAAQFEALGYKAQIFPRPINLFYIKEGLRERIVQENKVYKVLNTDINFNEQELINAITNQPENFSPNVCLRPLYQETILPNLAAILGPGELAYWLLLKPVFENYSVDFPVLFPRMFAAFTSEAILNKAGKLGVSAPQLLLSKEALKKYWLENVNPLEDSQKPDAEIDNIIVLLDNIAGKANSIDAGLKDFALASKANIEKQLENVAAKMKKAAEKKHETAIQQLSTLSDKMMPEGSLQERIESYYTYGNNSPELLKYLCETEDIFNHQLRIITP